jgi:membrane fusion protein, heavy metal efflux system
MPCASGKTEAAIDEVVAQRKVDGTLVVASPIDGRVTARNARPGLFVQPARAKVRAYPDRVFQGKVSTIGTAVDPNTHRTFVRDEIKDPDNFLLAGMYGSFVIETGPPLRATAVPDSAVVREGDGTMTVFVTTDGRRFVKRIVETGLRQDGFVQILKGLKPGEQVATTGALQLSNMLALGTAAKD